MVLQIPPLSRGPPKKKFRFVQLQKVGFTFFSRFSRPIPFLKVPPLSSVPGASCRILQNCSRWFLAKHVHVARIVYSRLYPEARRQKFFVNAKLCGTPVHNLQQLKTTGVQITFGRRTPKTVGISLKHVLFSEFLFLWAPLRHFHAQALQ